MTTAPVTRRLLKQYRQADAEIIARGRRWYATEEHMRIIEAQRLED